jgi:hypothetical protein
LETPFAGVPGRSGYFLLFKTSSFSRPITRNEFEIHCGLEISNIFFAVTLIGIFTKGETMKKTYLLLAGALCLATAVFAAANFSGTWALDPAKSDQAQTGQGASETKYVLDGKENTESSQRGELKYKAVREGNSLTISGVRTTQRGERPMKEVYSLSADGKVLTIESTRSGQQGETTRKQVFNKK